MILARALLVLLMVHVGTVAGEPFDASMNSQFLKVPNGILGDAHGDIAVSAAGDVYVSVQGGANPGIQVYDSTGRYLRNVPNAPADFHGFVIATASDGAQSLYGARLVGQQIVRLALDGRVLLTIDATLIPDRYKALKDGKYAVDLTGIAVAPGGDIYVVDGYGRDFIHRFDASGRYVGTFGGRSEPWNFEQCHKIAIDSRFTPARLLCTDRLHNRLIHMDLEGRPIGTFAENLNWPSAVATFENYLAVAELGGRVSILDEQGRVLTTIGANGNPQQTKTNRVPPEQWQPTLFYAPHGVAFDQAGNLFVTEWSRWGRVVRVNRNVMEKQRGIQTSQAVATE